MSCQKTWCSLAAILVPVSLLAACGGGGSGVREVTHGGSVGDGPITGATVVVTDKNGVVLATETSDETANYEIRLKVPKQSYPLQITATGGIDTVTQSEPDFTMVSVATDPSQSKANINPFSTLITKMALAMAGGLTDANIKVARNTVISTFGFGFDPTLIPDPVRTPVTETNIAAMVKASEALGEAVRRSRDALLIQGESVSGDSIMNAIAADMIDGSVDGAGASDSDPRTAAVINVVAGQVLIEAMSNQLKVGDADATQAMDDAIRISMPDAPPTAVTRNVRIPRSMIEQTQRAVDAARAIAPDSALSTIASVISTLPSDALPSDIEQLLPGDTSADLDRAISGAVFATDTQLGDVNKVGRTFADVNNDTDNGTGSETGTGAGGDTSTGISANNGPDAGTRTNADAGTGAGSTRGSGVEAGAGAVAQTPTRTSRRRSGGGTGTGGTNTGSTTDTSASTDNQPRARSDSTSTDENQNVTIAVLNNDRGLEDTPLNVTVAEQPAHGNVTVNDNNTVTYTPDADYSGEENFSYQVTDVDGDLSIATVTINVICTSGCVETSRKLTPTDPPDLRSPTPSGYETPPAGETPSEPGKLRVSNPEPEPSIVGDFTLTFNDEFEGEAIDGTKWRMGGTYMSYPGSAGIAPANAWVKDGSLWLKAEKRTSTFGTKSYKYSAAGISTYDHFSQRYGLWEARIRYDAIRGLWPAFWTMPDRGARGRKAGYYRSFLKFDLSSLGDVAISTAELQLVVQSFEVPPPQKTSQIMIQPVPNDDWNELSIVWDSQPAPRPNWIHHQVNPALSLGGTYAVDLTEYIQRERDTDGVASLRIQDGFSRTYGMTFHSREADNPALRPRLVVNGNIILHPVADAYVRGGTYSSENFGAETVLISRDDWANSESTYDGGMEMDIMEALGIWGNDVVAHAVHWDGYGAEHRSEGSGQLRIPSTDDDFHTYAMYWEPGKISFIVDGTVTYVYESPRACSVPSYALLSLQMGGWAGNDKIDEESLPGFMEVDWVRIWSGTPREGS